MYFYGENFDNIRAVVILFLCSITFIIVALNTRPTASSVLDKFYKKIRPEGYWKPVALRNPDVKPDNTGKSKWIGWFFGSVFIYTAILGLGYIFTNKIPTGIIMILISGVSSLIALKFAKKVFGFKSIQQIEGGGESNE